MRRLTQEELLQEARLTEQLNLKSLGGSPLDFTTAYRQLLVIIYFCDFYFENKVLM